MLDLRLAALGLVVSLALSPRASAQSSAEPDRPTETTPAPAAAGETGTEPDVVEDAAAEAAEAEPPTTRTTTSSTAAGAGGARSTATITRGGRGATDGAAPAPAPEEEEEGDGRDVDFLWIEVEGGVSDVNLIAFNDTNFASAIMSGMMPGPAFTELRGTGPFLGLGAGFRVYILAVGARLTYANYQNFDIGNIGGDVTLRLPIPIVEPYVRVGFGYAWQGQANYQYLAMSSTTVYGWSFDSAAGLDIYLANWFTIGAGIGFNLMNMSRQTDPTMPCMAVTDICPGNPGDAIGYQLRGFVQVGFRF